MAPRGPVQHSQGAPHSTLRRPQEAPGRLRRPQEPPGGTGTPQEASGGTWGLLALVTGKTIGLALFSYHAP